MIVRIKRKFEPIDRAKSRYCIMMFTPAGMYPGGTFCSPSAIFHADTDVVFAVACGHRWCLRDEDLPYSEADWMLPELLRLLGALMMTEQWPDGLRNRFYPLINGSFDIDAPSLDLTRPETAAAVKAALLPLSHPNARGSTHWKQHNENIWKVCSGKTFDVFDPHELSIDCYQDYWSAIDPGNHLLMRGIQALIKSDMLAAHPEFMEEATIATFIALDTSFELILRHLRSQGIENPSAKHAGDWLYEVFDEPLGVYGAQGMKYFEEFYTQRVQSIHPGSRFGDVPFAPVAYDDYIHLRQTLPGIFGYLLLGRHTPNFYQLIAERQAQWDRRIPRRD